MTLRRYTYKSSSVKQPSVCRRVLVAVLVIVLATVCTTPVNAQKYVITESARQRLEQQRIARNEKKESRKEGKKEKLVLKEKKKNIITTFKEDSTAWVNGIQINADIAGPITSVLSNKSYFEAAAKLSVKDMLYPTLELGYAFTDYEEPTSSIAYKANGLYGRLGFDFNMLKNKHDKYKFFLGTRIAATSFSYDVSAPGLEDPVWGGDSGYRKDNATCSYLWLEFLAGVDARLVGPLSLGWTMRYKRRLSNTYTGLNKAWYVPGYGNDGTSAFQATFTVGIELFDIIKKKK